jgi:hypothetical protein
LIRDLLVKVADSRVEFAVETHRMIQQDIRQFAFGQHKTKHAPQIVAQLLDWIGFARTDAQTLDSMTQLVEDLRQQLLKKIPLVLEIEIEGAPRDLRTRNYVGDIRAMIALTGEYPLCVAQHLLAPSLPFHN